MDSKPKVEPAAASLKVEEKKADSPKPEVMKKAMKAPARPLKSKAAPAKVTKKTSSTSVGKVVKKPSVSPGRVAKKGISPNKVNEYNQKFVEQLKSASIDLRKSGIDIETEPVLELGLLLDCTSSMGSWIAKAKQTIHEIIDRAIKECEEDGSLKCRVSFIGYRDIKDHRRFEVMPFNENIEEAKTFISGVKAQGGADMPEDMQGGLKLCLLQDWTEEAIKRVVIITDAPPHGKQYQNKNCGDDYPNGSPDGIQIEDLMKEFCKKEIDFQVIKLNNSVDKMIEVMKQSHQEVDVVDMSGIKEEARLARMAEMEAMGGGGGGGADDSDVRMVRAIAPSCEEVDEYMTKKFIEGTTKGISSKVKSKKMAMKKC